MVARKRRVSICFEGWYYLAVIGFILVGAVLREINLLMLLFGMMLGPYVLSYFMVVSAVRGTQVRRRLPERICAGQLLSVDIELTNIRRWMGLWAVVVSDRIEREDSSGNLEVVRPEVLFTYVGRQQTQVLGYQGRLSQRGRYLLGPLTLSTRFPIGLLRGSGVIAEQQELIVYPILGKLSKSWSNVRQSGLLSSQQAKGQQGLIEGDFHGLRDFRTGDSIRWIHWRTSARHNELMVRQFEKHASEDLAIFLDLWQPDAQPQSGDAENVELAVSFAATIISDQCRRGGSQLTLVGTSPELNMVRGPASTALLHDAMERLAVARSVSTDLLPETLARGLEGIRAGTNVVLISTRPVDLADTTRFAPLWADPRQRQWATRAICIDTSSTELQQFYHPE